MITMCSAYQPVQCAVATARLIYKSHIYRSSVMVDFDLACDGYSTKNLVGKYVSL